MPGPTQSDKRTGTALCLSGGGYRAMLFHLGALRRLNELGLLPQLTTISSVSGGSLLAGLMAVHLPWPLEAPLPPGEWEARFARHVRALARTDLRTRPLLRGALRNLSGGLLGERAVEALAGQLEQPFQGRRLGELPRTPAFVVCATDLSFGVLWTFRRTRMGSYRAGYTSSQDFPLARAVAASACFPPVFGPMRLQLRPQDMSRGKATLAPQERARVLSRLTLTDGGVYANDATEAVWKSHATVLVSDGGGSLDFAVDRQGPAGLLRRLARYVSIVDAQSRSVRRRMLIGAYQNGTLDGAYWGIGGSAGNYREGAPGYPPEVAGRLRRVRTDLDAFGLAETAALENHGYFLADAALGGHARLELPLDAPLQAPHPEWLDPDHVLNALQSSEKTVLFGRR